MVYTETGIFKRYKRNRTDKDGKTKEVTQVGVSGLSVNSQFDDNEEIIIISKKEFTELEGKILELESTAPEPVTNQKYYNELIQAKDEISNLKDIINNRNGLLMDTKDSISTVMEELLNEVTQLYEDGIKTGNKKTLDNVRNLVNLIQASYTNIYNYLLDLETDHNNKIDNSNLLGRLRKSNSKLHLDQSKLLEFENTLKEINEYYNNYTGIVETVEIPTSNITKIRLKHLKNDIKLNELYIGTVPTDEDTNKDIDITPDKTNQ